MTKDDRCTMVVLAPNVSRPRWPSTAPTARGLRVEQHEHLSRADELDPRSDDHASRDTRQASDPTSRGQVVSRLAALSSMTARAGAATDPAGLGLVRSSACEALLLGSLTPRSTAPRRPRRGSPRSHRG